MKSLVDSLKKTVSLPLGTLTSQENPNDIVFVKSQKAILKELIKSRNNGTLIGVYSRALGEGMFLTGVNQIEEVRGVEVITFETYDQTGQILNRTQLSIDEIRMVYPFSIKYTNPILFKPRFV